MAILDPFIHLIERILAPLLKPIQPLIKIVTDFYNSTTNILAAGKEVIDLAIEDYEKIKNFELKPHWKGRVIQVETAVEKIQRLGQIPSEIAGAIRDVISSIKSKFENLGSAEDAISDLEGMEDLENIIKRFGAKFVKGFERILGIATLVVDALVTIESVIADIQTILQDLGEVIDDLDNFDLVFLQQKNPRRLEHLVEGGKIKIRVGNLHS